MESYLSRHNFIATSFRDRLSIDARFTNSLIAKTELRKITGEALKNLPSPLIDQFQFASTFSFDLGGKGDMSRLSASMRVLRVLERKCWTEEMKTRRIKLEVVVDGTGDFRFKRRWKYGSTGCSGASSSPCVSRYLAKCPLYTPAV